MVLEEGAGKKDRKLPKGIYKGGRIYWICYADAAGKMRHESSESAHLRQAESLLATRRDQRYRARKYPELVRSEKTLGEVVEHYRRHIKKAATAHQIEPRLDDALAFFGEETKIV